MPSISDTAAVITTGINIAGAAGEFYAAYRLVKEKKEAAVVDDGVQLRYWT